MNSQLLRDLRVFGAIWWPGARHIAVPVAGVRGVIGTSTEVQHA